MQLSNIKVGDVVGIKSDNPSSIRYYKYERAKVLEVNDNAFRIERGWFPKDNGRKGFNIIISLDEVLENNTNFYLSRRVNRLLDNIKGKLDNIGISLDDIELLEKILLLLNKLN
jgi:hypothetical protein